jgi:TM2 domain-containing membrane protein YozV
MDWTDHRVPAPVYQPVAYVQHPDRFSHKSSAVAGLLQLFFGWFGIGRFYVGSSTSIVIGVVQLVLGLLGLLTSLFIVGVFILIPLSIWTLVDAIVLFASGARDSEGRQLR